MGQVVPFISRVRDSGDWTASERARLEDLADRLNAAGVDVDVIFGATDEGDPWCVVTDANGDVLIHVARIGGVFVVHSAVDDAVSEGMDLHAALRERLAATEDVVAPKSATILPFDLSARQGQTLLALVVAAAFFYETAAPGEAQAAEPPPPAAPPEEPPPPPTDADPVTQDRETTARGAAAQDDDDTATPVARIVDAESPAAPAPAAPAEPEPPPMPPAAATVAAPEATAQALSASPDTGTNSGPVVEIRGTDSDDHLVGTKVDERILGGAGNDTLEGGGGHDTLDGGAGDDRIELGAAVVAIGGSGADTFVIHRPGPADAPHGPPPDGFFFGTILDFNGAQGDRIVNGQGVTVRLTPRPDRTGPADGQPSTSGTDAGPPQTGGGDHGLTLTATFTPGQPLRRVDVDLDGDGVDDGYILVGGHGAHWPPAGDDGAENLTDHGPPPITAMVGHGLMGGGDLFG